MHPHDIPMLLGQLVERSTQQLAWMAKVDSRLEQGWHRMDDMTKEIQDVRRHIKRVEKKQTKIGWVERWVKDVLTYLLPILLPLTLLAVTGRIETVTALIDAAAKFHTIK